MGSNMAECHPVAFRWPLMAKTDRGAVLIHVDPRFTRTSALCDTHVAIRAGSDIVFLGALINHVINSKRWNSDPFFNEYVVNYTNAATLINPDFKDTEDLDGVFSGISGDGKSYSNASWSYQRNPAPAPAAAEAETFSDLLLQRVPGRPRTDITLQDPHCVFQIVREHYARYTPEMVESVCGCTKEMFLKVAETLLANSGRDKTSNITYAVGWTQHTVGVQIIRAAGMLQALLGNMGRPGGGILALRGHATIQGSTDIATLYHSLPGYLNMPDARKAHDTLRDFILTRPCRWRRATGATTPSAPFPISRRSSATQQRKGTTTDTTRYSRRSTATPGQTTNPLPPSPTSLRMALPPAAPGSTPASSPRRGKTGRHPARQTIGCRQTGVLPGLPTATSCTTGPLRTPGANPGRRKRNLSCGTRMQIAARRMPQAGRSTANGSPRPVKASTFNRPKPLRPSARIEPWPSIGWAAMTPSLCGPMARPGSLRRADL